MGRESVVARLPAASADVDALARFCEDSRLGADSAECAFRLCGRVLAAGKARDGSTHLATISAGGRAA